MRLLVRFEFMVTLAPAFQGCQLEDGNLPKDGTPFLSTVSIAGQANSRDSSAVRKKRELFSVRANTYLGAFASPLLPCSSSGILT